MRLTLPFFRNGLNLLLLVVSEISNDLHWIFQTVPEVEVTTTLTRLALGAQPQKEFRKLHPALLDMHLVCDKVGGDFHAQ